MIFYDSNSKVIVYKGGCSSGVCMIFYDSNSKVIIYKGGCSSGV